MKRKGFTLLELLVVLVILTAVAGITVGLIKGTSYDEDADMSMWAPEVETARSQRRMADELARQNDLMQRRIELLESQNKKAESDQ